MTAHELGSKSDNLAQSMHTSTVTDVKKVNVSLEEEPRFKAYGPGLAGGYVGCPAKFTVERNWGKAGLPGFKTRIDGPEKAHMSMFSKCDGFMYVTYHPTVEREYAVHILCDGEDIPDSPYMAHILPNVADKNPDKEGAKHNFDTSKVRVNGRNISCCRAEMLSSFHVYTFGVPEAPLDVQILYADGTSIETEPQIRKEDDNTYQVTYTANKERESLLVKVLYNKEQIPNSPFSVRIRPRSEPCKVKISGPALNHEADVYASMDTIYLEIDTSQAGCGNLENRIIGPDGEPRIDCTYMRGDGICETSFTPDVCGQYTISIRYDDQDVPLSPIHIQVKATGSASDCHYPSLQDQIFRGLGERKFIVDAKNAGLGKITCRIKSLDGKKEIDTKVIDNADGTFTVHYEILEPGAYISNVNFGGQLIPDGLCTFTVEP